MCLNPITMRYSSGIRHVPCGVCRECMQSRRRDWSIRSLFEFEDAINKHWSPYFLTLTYDDEHLTRKLNEDTGEFVPVLNYDNWHQCTNYLRVAHGITADNYRYLLCGEYGSKHLRPHYHVLIFVDNVSIIRVLGDYWYEHFCPKALQMINDLEPDSHGIIYHWGELGFRADPVTQTDASSPLRVARYVSKYIVKGSFDKTKNEYKDFYCKYPARVYASRAYGMSRLEKYREDLKHFTGVKRIPIREQYNTVYGPVKINNKKTELYEYSPTYLEFIRKTLRIYLGQDMRDPTKPFYAPLPKVYFDKLLPKRMYIDTVVVWDGEERKLEKRKRRVKEIPSLVTANSTQTAVTYYSQEAMLRKSLSIAKRHTCVEDGEEIYQYLREQDYFDRLRDNTLSAEFEFRNASHYNAEKDLQ